MKYFWLSFCIVLSTITFPSFLKAQDRESEYDLEEIVITSTRNRRSFEQQPTRVEVLGSEEINEKANMKPGDIRMLLNETTGIHIQQTSATSFNSSIRIQGLNGKYTQILRDGMPLYGGFSGGLGLLQIAPLDLQQVELIKGSSSTLYGGGAIAGLVNLITKKPGAEPESSLLLNATSAGGIDASGFFSSMGQSVGSSLFTSYNKSIAYDPADNGFSAIPKFERWTFNPRLFVEGSNSELRLGINAVIEDRIGGDMDYIEGNRINPAYFEKSSTERISTQIEYSSQWLSGNEFVFRNSINHYQRDLNVPEFSFAGTQVSSFSEVHILGASSVMEWVAGLNLWTENFDHDEFSRPLVTDSALDFNSQTMGAFFQGTYAFSDQWIFESGLRVDSTADYGDFLLPRVSLLYKPSAQTSLRFGGGLGYKEPTPFSEEAEMIQFRGLMRIDSKLLDAEKSAGLNFDINQTFEFGNDLSLDLNVLLFYTRVEDPIRLMEFHPKQYAYRQPDDYLDTQGSEISTVWRWNDFKYVFGYTHADVKEHGAIEVNSITLMPKDRINNVFVYEREDDIRIGVEAYYYGQQLLNDGNKSRDFWVFGLMIEKSFEGDFSFFLNFENFSDSRQTRFDSIYSGPRVNPVFADIFAPLDGFVINGGIKLQF